MAMKNCLYNMSILNSMKLKFDTVRDILKPNKCTKFQLILTENRELAYFLVATVIIFIKIHLK